MTWKIIYFLIIYNSLISVYCLWEEFAGPYYVKPKQLAKCRDNGKDLFVYSTKLHKVNRTHHAYTGNMSWGYDLDNTKLAHVLGINKGTNGRWNTLLEITGHTCDLINMYLKTIMSSLMRAAKQSYVCPVPKGDYMVKDGVLDFNLIKNLPVVPYGDYRLEIAVLEGGKGKGQERLGCISFFFEVRPRYEIERPAKASKG